MGVVLQSDDDYVWIFPIGGCDGNPRHRAEIRMWDASDRLQAGVSFKNPVVRCHTLVKVSLRGLRSDMPVGSMPEHLMRSIIAASRKEAETQAREARMAYMHVEVTLNRAVSM